MAKTSSPELAAGENLVDLAPVLKVMQNLRDVARETLDETDADVLQFVVRNLTGELY